MTEARKKNNLKQRVWNTWSYSVSADSRGRIRYFFKM